MDTFGCLMSAAFLLGFLLVFVGAVLWWNGVTGYGVAALCVGVLVVVGAQIGRGWRHDDDEDEE